MPQIRGNKITVPVNADAYNLTADLATMADSAFVVIPVSSQAERDALVKVAGKCVIRLDLPSLPIERCDGTNWIGVQYAEFTSASNTATSGVAWGMGTFTLDATPTTDSAFVTINAVDKLQVTSAGIYDVTQLVAFTATISGVSWIAADGNYTTTMGSGLQNFISTRKLKLAAGGIIQPMLSHGSGSNRTFTGRVTVQKVG